jgi:hypothetical protein
MICVYNPTLTYFFFSEFQAQNRRCLEKKENFEDDSNASVILGKILLFKKNSHKSFLVVSKDKGQLKK